MLVHGGAAPRRTRPPLPRSSRHSWAWGAIDARLLLLRRNRNRGARRGPDPAWARCKPATCTRHLPSTTLPARTTATCRRAGRRTASGCPNLSSSSFAGTMPALVGLRCACPPSCHWPRCRHCVSPCRCCAVYVSARSKTNTMHGTEGTEGKIKLYGLWKVFLRRAKAATKVQALWRGRTARKQFHEQLAARLAAAVLLQKAWRRCLAALPGTQARGRRRGHGQRRGPSSPEEWASRRQQGVTRRLARGVSSGFGGCRLLFSCANRLCRVDENMTCVSMRPRCWGLADSERLILQFVRVKDTGWFAPRAAHRGGTVGGCPRPQPLGGAPPGPSALPLLVGRWRTTSQDSGCLHRLATCAQRTKSSWAEPGTQPDFMASV